LDCKGPRFGLGTAGSQEVFEPPQDHKGNVARALFYFATRYELTIGKAEEEVLRKWNQEDPVDQEELDRNEEIFKVQQNRNPFVDFPELVDRISDF
jgi:endonuclease I